MQAWRLFRWIVGLALDGALVASGALTARAAPVEPVDGDEWLELVAFLEPIRCPELGSATLVLRERPFIPASQVIDGIREPTDSLYVSCEYDSSEVAPIEGQRLRVNVSVARSSTGTPYECRSEPSETRDDPIRQRVELGAVLQPAAISLSYDISEGIINAHPNVESQIPERFLTFAEQFESLALVCQYVVPPIECPVIAEFSVENVEEASPNDLLSARCYYVTSTEEVEQRLEVSVLWATDRSTPDAQRRACEDFGETVRARFGVVGGDGISSEAQ